MRTNIEITHDTLICLYVKFEIPVYCTTFNIYLQNKKLKTMRTIRRPIFIIHSIGLMKLLLVLQKCNIENKYYRILRIM